MVGSEEEPDARHAGLEVTLILEGPTGAWQLDTDKLVLVLGTPLTSLRPSAVTDDSGSGFTRWTISYPEPAGLEDRVELRFETGALMIHSNAVDLAPLHFNRVKKSDVYFASINC
jgi:hypothetical protein